MDNRQVAKKIGFLGRISNKLNMMNRLTLYKSIIAPHFDYCATITFLCNKGEFKKLQKLQNRAMRIILKVNKRTSIKLMLEALCLLNVRQRITLLAMVFIFKLKNNMLPKSLVENISYVGQGQTHMLRNNNDFKLPSMRKVSSQNCLYHKGLKEFNKLPANIKQEVNLVKFKKLLIEHIKVNIK